MSREREEKTWSSQQIPENVSGAKPRPDKEPAPETPKRPESK